MPKKQKPGKVEFTRTVIARGSDRDFGLGPGILYKDEIEYTNDEGPFQQSDVELLAARVVMDNAELLNNLFEVIVKPLKREDQNAPETK